MTDQGKFLVAHANGPSWQEAAGAIIRELQSIGAEHRLGFLYVTDAFANSLKEISIFLRHQTGVPH